jgi:hypothetical protein
MWSRRPAFASNSFSVAKISVPLLRTSLAPDRLNDFFFFFGEDVIGSMYLVWTQLPFFLDVLPSFLDARPAPSLFFKMFPEHLANIKNYLDKILL